MSSSPSSQTSTRDVRVAEAVQAEQAKAGHALAGAGLADDAERLAAFEREGHAVDRLDEAVFGREVDLEITHVEECLGLHGVHRWGR